ncbi:MAG: hypothetical protein JSW10_00385 [Pseudomonadota bacterium]|nr:MAG: hypothetical protein JSW10_00385 [Pseudomonadota bacterium]
MHETRTTRTFKALVVDALMGAIFLLLMVFSAWLIWQYYFRAPVEIPSAGVGREATKEDIRLAREYPPRHFHNMDEVVLAGIQSGSPCIKCHGDYPHSKADNDRRGFLNAHAWFVACETCHLKPEDRDKVIYRWYDNKTGEEMTKLEGPAGIYGGMIAPVKFDKGTVQRLDRAADVELIDEYLRTKNELNEGQQATARAKIHDVICKSPIFCDSCHTEKGVLDFEKLLYPPRHAAHLRTIDPGAMIKTYKAFHFPNIFDPK